MIHEEERETYDKAWILYLVQKKPSKYKFGGVLSTRAWSYHTCLLGRLRSPFQSKTSCLGI